MGLANHMPTGQREALLLDRLFIHLGITLSERAVILGSLFELAQLNLCVIGLDRCVMLLREFVRQGFFTSSGDFILILI